MRIIRVVRVSVATLAAGALVASVATSASLASRASVPIRVLAIEDLSGPTASIGADKKAGLIAAVTYLNSHGGIDGHQVTLYTVDDAGNPTTAITDLVSYVSSNGKPNLLIPGNTSTIATAVLPEAVQLGVLTLGLGDGNFYCGTNAAANCGNYFTNTVNPTASMIKAVQYLASKHYKSVGVIEQDSTFAQEEYTTLSQLLPAKGIKVVSVTVPAATVDFTPEMSTLQADNPNVVLALEQLGANAGYVLTARTALGWNVPVLYDVASASTTDLTTLVPKSEWSTNVTLEEYDANLPSKAKQFPGQTLMAKSDPKELQPGGFAGEQISGAAYGWDGLMAYDTVVSATKSLNPTTDATWMEHHVIHIPHPAATAEYVYSVTNHEDQGWSPADFSMVPAAPVGNSGVLELNAGTK